MKICFETFCSYGRQPVDAHILQVSSHFVRRVHGNKLASLSPAFMLQRKIGHQTKEDCMYQ